MATLALKPAFPIRTRSSGTKRGNREPRARDALQSRLWRTVAATGAAIAVTFFSVLAPLIDDPAGRLFALEMTSTIPTEEAFRPEAWSARAFEFTPTMLGPAIADDILTLAEEDWSVVTMPELEIRALPPMGSGASTPPG